MITAAFLAWLAAAPIADLEATRNVCIEYGTCDVEQLMAVQAEIRRWMNGERER